MWWSRTADGFRGWLLVEDRNGALRPGIPSGQFTVTVVRPDGTVALAPTVNESTAKPGFYYFDVTNTFLTTHGVGEYFAGVEVNATSAPRVTATFGKVLRASVESLDTIGLNVGYAGSVHIDTKNGVAGTAVGVNGTTDNPVSNLADAVALAASIGLRKYTLVGNITLTSAHDDWIFEGQAAEAAINFGGQDVADSLFSNCQLSGNIGNGPIQTITCALDGVGNFTGRAFETSLDGTTSLGAGSSIFNACYSAVPGLATPGLDLGGAASVSISSYSGGIELFNVSGPSQNVTLGIIGGLAVIGPSNTDGTITLRGVGNITDTSSGTTIEKNAFLNLDAIWDEIQDGTIDARTIMTRINAMARGRVTLSGGTPKPAQDAVYFDEAGSPIYTNRNTGDERNPV